MDQSETLRSGAVSAEPPDLREVLKVILTAIRGDEKSHCWAIRKWLDKRGIFNGDIGGTDRLIEEACKAALAVRPHATGLPERLRTLARELRKPDCNVWLAPAAADIVDEAANEISAALRAESRETPDQETP